MSQPRPTTFEYRFRLADGVEKVFTLRLDPRTCELRQPPPASYPDWVALTYHQCPNCPLDPTLHPRCPIAANLVELLGFFGSLPSHDDVTVHIRTPERYYGKRTSVQQGVSSMLGIYMVTSGCPIMDHLRPMVRFHLPFANLEETAYRVTSMYLLAQYVRRRRGLRPDWEMRGLGDVYAQVQRVNRSFLERLREVAVEDGSTNALAILGSLATYVSFAVVEDALQDLEYLFAPYLDDDGPTPRPA